MVARPAPGFQRAGRDPVYPLAMSESQQAPPRPAAHPALEDAARKPPTATSRFLAIVGIGLGVLYVINPSFGLFELIPDNIPIIGNLDEAAATTLVIYGIQHLARRRKT